MSDSQFSSISDVWHDIPVLSHPQVSSMCSNFVEPIIKWCIKMFLSYGQKIIIYPYYDQSFTFTSWFVAFNWEIWVASCMCSNRYIHICLQKDLLQVKVNKLTSTKTQLPYSYYSLPFCKPNTIVDSAENLGEVLRGDRIENSPYVVSTSLLPHIYSPL